MNRKATEERPVTFFLLENRHSDTINCKRSDRLLRKLKKRHRNVKTILNEQRESSMLAVSERATKITGGSLNVWVIAMLAGGRREELGSPGIRPVSGLRRANIKVSLQVGVREAGDDRRPFKARVCIKVRIV